MRKKSSLLSASCFMPIRAKGGTMYRKEMLSYCLSLLFVFAAIALHFLDAFHGIPFSVHVVIFSLYGFIVFLWCRNMENRLLRTSSIRLFQCISLLLMGYLALRTVKYEILLENPVAKQYIRYGYYCFTLNIVHLVFITSLLIDKSEQERINRRWNLLWIPTELLVLLILTNEFHGLAFSLTDKGAHQYGPVFYLVLLYILLLAIATIIHTLIPSFATKQFRPILLPIGILSLWMLYTLLYVFDWKPFYPVRLLVKSAEFNILMVLLFIEALVFMRLLPSNRGYGHFLKMSALNIGIMNAKGETVIAPNKGPAVRRELLIETKEHPVSLDANTLLESAEIQGGRSFWFVDLTDFNALKTRLFALNEDMMSENDLLDADNKLKEKMAKLDEQKQIRSAIDAKLNPQFRRLEEIIAHMPEEEEAFENALKDACIYNVYIKRYSNLFLLAKTKEQLSLAELGLAITESLHYLQLRGVTTDLQWQSNDLVDAAVCLRLYEVFQTILELHFPFLSSLSIALKQQGKCPVWTMALETTKHFSIRDRIAEREDGVVVHMEEQRKGVHSFWRITVEGEAHDLV